MNKTQKKYFTIGSLHTANMVSNMVYQAWTLKEFNKDFKKLHKEIMQEMDKYDFWKEDKEK